MTSHYCSEHSQKETNTARRISARMRRLPAYDKPIFGTIFRRTAIPLRRLVMVFALRRSLALEADIKHYFTHSVYSDQTDAEAMPLDNL